MTRRLLTLVIGLALAAGCASKGTLQVATPPSSPLAGYNTVLIDVSCPLEDATKQVIELESTLAAMLREQGLFERVFTASAAPDATPDLRLKAKITKLRRVSSGQRVFFGALAGRAGMVVDVELVDPRSENKIANFTAEGKSSGGTVLAGTTDQAVQRVAEQIVAFLRKNRAVA